MTTKILVVDDEPELERLIKQRFRRKIKNQQYTFSFARSAIEAIEIVKEDAEIDIILSDINMPQMNGLTFISKLDEINTMLKKVMVSAYGNMKNIRTAMNHGAYDFITKPIDFKDLEATIEKAIKEIEILKVALYAKEKLNSLQQDLIAASEVQQSILPKNFSIFPENIPYELYAEMIPAREVGGDFYDFFLLEENRLGFVIGDVSGKGMASAIFMAVSQSMLKAIAFGDYTPAECLEQINYLLSQDNASCMFVTLFYGVLDMNTGVISYCNGGHLPPFLLTENNEIQSLGGSTNIALGILEDASFEGNSIQLAAGESLILYTDGITEAVNKKTEEYAKQRLERYLVKNNGVAVKEMTKGLILEVNTFSQGMPQADDITTLVIRHLG